MPPLYNLPGLALRARRPGSKPLDSLELDENGYPKSWSSTPASSAPPAPAQITPPPASAQRHAAGPITAATGPIAYNTTAGPFALAPPAAEPGLVDRAVTAFQRWAGGGETAAEKARRGGLPGQQFGMGDRGAGESVEQRIGGNALAERAAPGGIVVKDVTEEYEGFKGDPEALAKVKHDYAAMKAGERQDEQAQAVAANERDNASREAARQTQAGLDAKNAGWNARVSRVSGDFGEARRQGRIADEALGIANQPLVRAALPQRNFLAEQDAAQRSAETAAGSREGLAASAQQRQLGTFVIERANERAGLVKRYQTAKPEERPALAEAIRAIDGKIAEARYRAVTTGGGVDPATSAALPQNVVIVDERTGDYKIANQPGPGATGLPRGATPEQVRANAKKMVESKKMTQAEAEAELRQYGL